MVLEIEISREQIPLRNAYKHIGQKATIRVNSGIDIVLPGDTTCPNVTPPNTSRALFSFDGTMRGHGHQKDMRNCQTGVWCPLCHMSGLVDCSLEVVEEVQTPGGVKISDQHSIAKRTWSWTEWVGV